MMPFNRLMIFVMIICLLSVALGQDLATCKHTQIASSDAASMLVGGCGDLVMEGRQVRF